MDYKDENIWLMLGDCVKRMKNMSSESVTQNTLILQRKE